MAETLQLHDNNRIARLDGVRALAVVLVFLIHDDIGRFGWMGVPLFFVLSGFLITGILRRSQADQHFWAPFYLKRATRILPPLVIAFLAAALFSKVAWGQVGLYELFFSANVAEVLQRNRTGTLSVLWSLAVEEQFYLFWPFAIRFLERKRLIQILVGVLVAEPILRAAFSPMFATIWPIFFLTPFQLDGLALGSLLALLVEDKAATERVTHWSGWAFGSVGVAFALMSTMSVFHRDSNSTLFNSVGYTMVYLLGGCLVAYLLLHPGSLASRLFGSRSLVFLGSISYGFYLFHLVGINLTEAWGRAHNFAHFGRWLPRLSSR